jgi:TolB-like protein/Tfp pilus assembly protein PilF
MQHFFAELKRRNVIRAAIAYLALSWLLVQILETLFPIFELSETSIRWIVIALAVGFLPFLLLAWAFEWTSEGIRRDASVPHEPANIRRRSRRLDRVIIVILTLALGYFAADKYLITAIQSASRASSSAGFAGTAPYSIAVLPFVDLSPQRDQEYFSDGITEELLNLLARIPALRVAARTSSFSFKDSNEPVPEIAQVLNVSHVLEGSVRKSGGRLRITAQLISGDDGFHLWSETYDRPEGDVFEIQEAISREIVATLELKILGDLPELPKTSPEAHALYLQGRYLERQGSPDSMARASEFFQQALELDPEYAAAWVALGITYTNQTAHGLRPWDEGHRMAREAVLKALEVDPANAAAYAQLSWLEHAYEGNLQAAAEYGAHALALGPGDPILLGNAAFLVQSLGRLEEAVRLHEYSAARSPVDPRSHFNLALAYYFAHRLDDAERSIRKTLALSPDYGSAWYRLGTVLLFKGEIEDALQAFEHESDEAFRVKGRALAYHSLNRREAADTALAELSERWGHQWPSEVAQVHAYREDHDLAFEWLEKSYEIEGPAGWGEWRLMLLYDNLRDDPRWQQFLAKVGASDQQLAKIRFEVSMPLPDR